MTFGNAAEYDVRFATNTGQFRADMSIIRREYAATTGAMSTESLRAAVAQEKLDRAIKQHGPTSLAAKNATVAYRRELDTLGQTSVRTGNRLHAAEGDVERFGRGMLSGTGILRGFGHAALFASTSVLGGYGLVYAIRTVIDVAKQEEVSLAKVKNALHDTGLEWSTYSDQIETATSRLEQHTAFTREELDVTLANLIRRTGDVAESIGLTGVAADIARGRTITLAAAGQILVKALNGQTGALRRLLLDIHTVTTAQDALKASGVKASAEQLAQAKAADQNATRQAALAQVQQKYAGASAAYLATAAGKQTLFNAELRDSEGIIGEGLLPVLNKLLGAGTTWLQHLNSTGQLQRDVNTAVKDGTEILHGFEGAIELIVPPIEAVVTALGGLKQTAEDVLILGLALKAKKAASSFGLIKTGSAQARTAVVEDAAVQDTALAGVATQAKETSAVVARVGLYTQGQLAGIGTAAGENGAAGKVGLLRSRLKSLSTLGPLAIPIILNFIPRQSGTLGSIQGGATSAANAGLLGYIIGGPAGAVVGASGEIIINQGHSAVTTQTAGTTGNPTISATYAGHTYTAPIGDAANQLTVVLEKLKAGKKLTKADVEVLLANGPPIIDPALNPDAQGPIQPSKRGGSTGGGTGGGGGGTAPTTGLSYAVQKELLEAQISGSQTAQLAADKDAIAELDKLLRQPGLTHADTLTLLGEKAQYASDAQSIEQQIASGRAAAARAAAERRSKAARAAAARARKATLAYRQGVAVEGKTLANKVLAALGSAHGQVTPELARAEAQAIAFDTTESSDKGLTGSQQARYARAAIVLRNKVNKELDAQLAEHRRQQAKTLEQIPVQLQIDLKLAKTEEQRLAILKRELAAVNGQLEEARKLHLTKAQIDKIRLLAAGIQEKINKESKAQTHSAASLFAEAASEYAAYGSNVAGAAGVLSRQDERGQLAELVLLQRQANRHAQQANRHAQRTAAATTALHRLARDGDDMIGEAFRAAVHGY